MLMRLPVITPRCRPLTAAASSRALAGTSTPRLSGMWCAATELRADERQTAGSSAATAARKAWQVCLMA